MQAGQYRLYCSAYQCGNETMRCNAPQCTDPFKASGHLDLQKGALPVWVWMDGRNRCSCFKTCRPAAVHSCWPCGSWINIALLSFVPRLAAHALLQAYQKSEDANCHGACSPLGVMRCDTGF